MRCLVRFKTSKTNPCRRDIVERNMVYMPGALSCTDVLPARQGQAPRTSRKNPSPALPTARSNCNQGAKSSPHHPRLSLHPQRPLHSCPHALPNLVLQCYGATAPVRPPEECALHDVGAVPRSPRSSQQRPSFCLHYPGPHPNPAPATPRLPFCRAHQ